MRKDPFDTPFFNDPQGYMEKAQRNFFIGFFIYMLLMVVGLFFLVTYVGNSVRENGGIAHMIGGFIKEVKTSSQ